VVVGLIDTTGYSSQIKAKYAGFLITETHVAVCGTALGVGSYGFGLERPAATSNADAAFKVYNQAGEKLGECAAKKDDSVKQPKPLGVTAEKSRTGKNLPGQVRCRNQIGPGPQIKQTPPIREMKILTTWDGGTPNLPYGNPPLCSYEEHTYRIFFGPPGSECPNFRPPSGYLRNLCNLRIRIDPAAQKPQHTGTKLEGFATIVTPDSITVFDKKDQLIENPYRQGLHCPRWNRRSGYGLVHDRRWGESPGRHLYPNQGGTFVPRCRFWRASSASLSCRGRTRLKILKG